MTETNTTELAAVKAADIAAKPLSIKDAVLAQFAEAETTLMGLAEKYRAVAYDVTTSKGMAEAKAARADLRDNGRLFVTKAETRIKAEVNDLKRVMSSEVERLVAIVKPHEDAIDAQIKAEEKRKEEEKAEKARIEAERVQKHQANLDKIAQYPKMLEGRTLEEMDSAITKVEAIVIGESWEEFADQAKQALAKALAGMRDVAARERMRLDNERMAEQLKQQAEELQRQQTEIMRQRVASAVFTFPEVVQATHQSIQDLAATVSKQVQDAEDKQAIPSEVAADLRVVIAGLASVGEEITPQQNVTAQSESDETAPVITTGSLCDRLGLPLRSEFIQSLGFEPVPCPGRGTYWKESDIKPIGLAIIEFIKGRINA